MYFYHEFHVNDMFYELVFFNFHSSLRYLCRFEVRFILSICTQTRRDPTSCTSDDSSDVSFVIQFHTMIFGCNICTSISSTLVITWCSTGALTTRNSKREEHKGWKAHHENPNRSSDPLKWGVCTYSDDGTNCRAQHEACRKHNAYANNHNEHWKAHSIYLDLRVDEYWIRNQAVMTLSLQAMQRAHSTHNTLVNNRSVLEHTKHLRM